MKKYALLFFCLIILPALSGCERSLRPHGSVAVGESGFLSELESIANELPDLQFTWITEESANQIPSGTDLILWSGNQTHLEWIRSSSLLQLSEYTGRMESHEENYLGKLEFHGNAEEYIVPIGAYTWGLLYRPDIISSVIPDFDPLAIKSLHDLEAVAVSLHEANIAPFALGAEFGWPAAAWFSYFDIRLNGTEAHRALIEGRRSFTDTGSIEALELLLQYARMGWFSDQPHTSGWIESVREVAAGRAGFVLLGTYAINRFPSHIDLNMLRFPGINPDSPDNSAELGQVLALAVPSDSRNPEGALALADRFVLAGSPGISSDGYRTAALPAGEEQGFPAFSADILSTTSSVFPSPERWVSPAFIQQGFRLFRNAVENPERYSAEELAAMLENIQ
ncbi:ABC transporter substrate-binding protein [Spirochaeta dissipatitropha]